MKTRIKLVILALAAAILGGGGAQAQSTAFTYQGQLIDNGAPANGSYDLRFALWDADSSGNAAGVPITNAATSVAAGVFVVTLDFGGAALPGAPRWLEIGVRPAGGAGAFSTLAPRQQLTAMPYAVQALNASNVLGRIADAQLSANIPRLNSAPTFVGAVSFNPLLGSPFRVNNSSLITNLNAQFLDGLDSAAFAQIGHTHGASDIVSGALADARLSPNVPLLNRAQTFSASNAFLAPLAATNTSNTFAGTFAGNGGGLNNLNAANLAGQIADARLSANIARLGSSQTFSATVAFNPAAGAPFLVGSAIRVTNLNADLLDGLDATAFWSASGNSGTSAANFIGTADNQTLDVRVNNTRALRFVPTAGSPNLLGGSPGNTVSTGIVGATVAGGGPVNAVGANYATIGGGSGNTASGVGATVAGGQNNAATNTEAIVAGGSGNTAGGQNSFAAGQNAAALHSGAFVWSDGSSLSTFTSTAPNIVIFRAAGGVGIGTNAPQSALHVAGTVQSSGLKMTTAPLAGALLASDAAGNASWQPPACRVSGSCSNPTLLGGYSNNAIFPGVRGATIAGGGEPGFSNYVGGDFGVVSGGESNRATAAWSVVGGGDANAATNSFATVAGGFGNSAGFEAAVGGGYRNAAAGSASVVGGGEVNLAFGADSVVAGGGGNRATNSYGAIGGGYSNTNTGFAATISGGTLNLASGSAATAPGGTANTASGQNSFAAGYHAQALHDGAFVWADFSSASPFASTAANQFLLRAAGGVGIGAAPQDAMLEVAGNARLDDNNIFFRTGSDRNHGLGWYGASPNKPFATTFFPDGPVLFGYGGGGLGTHRNGTEAVALAWDANQRVGIGTATPTAPLEIAFATGQSVQFRYEGSFVPGFNVATTGGNAGIMRYRNGLEVWPSDDATRAGKVDVRDTSGAPSIILDGQSGHISAAAFDATSDRNAKENFAPIDPGEILAKVAALPLSRWNFKQDKSARHLGPMAQDFYAAFAVGKDDHHITTVDADGVALAAIQGLNQKLQEKEAEIQQLQRRLDALEHSSLQGASRH